MLAMTVSVSPQVILGALLLIAGGVVLAISMITPAKRIFRRLFTEEPGSRPAPKARQTPTAQPVVTVRDTDQPAPIGFCDHVEVILAASPNATPEKQLEYLREGLSEADVLRCEVGIKPDSDETTEAAE